MAWPITACGAWRPESARRSAYRRLRQLKKGRLTCAEFGRQVTFVLTKNLQVSYIGYAITTGPAAAS